MEVLFPCNPGGDVLDRDAEPPVFFIPHLLFLFNSPLGGGCIPRGGTLSIGVAAVYFSAGPCPVPLHLAVWVVLSNETRLRRDRLTTTNDGREGSLLQKGGDPSRSSELSRRRAGYHAQSHRPP